MSKLRKFLLKKLATRKYAIFCTPVARLHSDEQYGRVYLEMPDGLRLIFDDGEYVGFSTQEPYVG